jgi:8-oxo-dGTP pyrophosphatase MutT (NUDIX family)
MHIHDAIDTTVEVFVVVGNQVLLRKHDKYGIWLSVGGHQELTEDPNEAAVREVREEVGLEIQLDGTADLSNSSADYTELACPAFMNRHYISDHHEHVTLVYFATAQTQILNKPATHEGEAECRWFTAKDLENASEVNEHTKKYAQAALRKLVVPRTSN